MSLKFRTMARLPEKNEDYNDINYWNTRYSQENKFEWCKSYSDFRDLIRQHVNCTDRVLMLGCGNSELSEDMYRDGYHSITNIDYSPVLIENMKNRSPEAKLMTWMVMDVTQMEFANESFDVIIEKATLDALLVGERDPWHLSEKNQKIMESILDKVSHLLVNGGRFISITFTQPHFRQRLYGQRRFNWNLRINTFGKNFHFYFYIMTKGETLEVDRNLDHKPAREDEPVTFLSYDDQDNYLSQIEF